MIRQKSITTRSLKTGWLEAGPDGAPILLFLHGFPDTADCWDRQIEHFSLRYKVVAPYIRGAGASESADRVARYSPDSVSLDILGILKAVDPSNSCPVYIVGHDLGSVHAWHLSRMLQKRAKGLVIINGLTIRQMLKRFKLPRQIMKSWYIFLMQIPLLPESIIGRFPGFFLRFAHNAGALTPSERPEFNLVKLALTGPLNQYRAFFREAPRLIGAVPEVKIKSPVLVIWGSDDAFLVPPTQDEMESTAENVVVRILKGNHWLHRVEPDKVNSIIDDFLTQNEAEYA